MSVITRSGEKLLAVSSALRLSLTASGSCPWAASRSQNSLMFSALSSTIRIFANSRTFLLTAECKALLHDTPTDPAAIALAALAATFGDARRAQRFIDLTGIGTDELRGRLGERPLLAALLRFLEAHEPDLLAVAEELGVKPDLLVQARRELEGNS